MMTWKHFIVVMGWVSKIPARLRTNFGAIRTRSIPENQYFPTTRLLHTYLEVNTRKPAGNFRLSKRAQLITTYVKVSKNVTFANFIAIN